MEHNHEEILRRVRGKLPGDELLGDLADLYRIFGDGTRIKILYALLEEEMCVCANLVGRRREGKEVFYFLSDSHVRNMIAQGFIHLMEERKEEGDEEE